MKKNLIAIAIVSAFGLAGCGSDSDSGSGGAPTATSSSFSGTVNKGIVSNGKVEICSDFTENTCDVEGSYYQTTATSETGSYDVTDAPLDTPLLVLVSKQDNVTTTMKCDTDVCTDNSGSLVDFGDSFEVPDDWTLKTIIPAANSATKTVNVTSLTDIAADEAIEVAGEGGVITEAIAKNANVAVQKAFGLTSSITEIGALDLTDAEAVAEANISNTEELQAATYSAVLLNVTDEAKGALVSYDAATEVYAVNVGDSTDSESDITITSLLGDAKTLLSTVETETNATLEASGAETISVTSIVSLIENTDIPESTTAIEPTTEVAAAKAFITDIRTAYNAVQDEGDLKAGLTDFQDELKGIDDLITDDLDIISDNLTNAVASIAEAFDDAADDATEYTSTEFGYSVTIKDDIYTIGAEDENVYIVATIINNTTSESSECNIYREFDTGNSDDNDTECPDGNDYVSHDEISGDASLVLTTVELHSGDTSLSANGLATLVGLSDIWDDAGANSYDAETQTNQYEYNYTGNSSIESLNIELEAMLAYVSSESTASFAGELTFSFDDLVATEFDTYTSSYNSGHTEETENNQFDFTVANMSLGFDGILTANDETINVDLSLVVDNSSHADSFIYAETENITGSQASFYDAWVSTVEKTNNEETSDNFITVTATANIATTLFDANGDKTDASINLVANRNQYNIVDTTITVNYNDVTTVLEADLGLYDTENSDLTIKNTIGAVATINALVDPGDDLAGEITIEGVKAASIEPADNGAVLVRYTDGTFESLF